MDRESLPSDTVSRQGELGGVLAPDANAESTPVSPARPESAATALHELYDESMSATRYAVTVRPSTGQFSTTMEASAAAARAGMPNVSTIAIAHRTATTAWAT